MGVRLLGGQLQRPDAGGMAERPWTLVEQVAEALEDMVAPRGVAVAIEATHLCTQMRGVASTSALTRTTCWRGAFADDPALRSEFLHACGW